MPKNLQKWLWRMALLLLFTLSLFYVLIQLNGLRFDFYTNEIRRTGIVSLSYTDSEAEIYLDDRRLEGGVPFSATGVLPGRYQLTVVKPGHLEYKLPVEVFSDRITRVLSVFLVPLDPSLKFKGLWAIGMPQEEFFWEGGYVFWVEGRILRWVRLAAASADQPHEVLLPFEDLVSIEVVSGNEAVLMSRDTGRRAILALNGSSIVPIAYSTNYQYVGNRWLYLKDDLLALFNREMNQLVWAKQPRPGSDIAAVKMSVVHGRVFLMVQFAEAGQNALYEVRSGGEFLLLSERDVDWVGVDTRGNVDYLVAGRELWKYLPVEDKSLLVRRFSEKVKLFHSDWRWRGSEGLLLFADDDGLWLADSGFDNVVKLLHTENVPYVHLAPDGTLFWGEVERQGGEEFFEVKRWTIWE